MEFTPATAPASLRPRLGEGDAVPDLGVQQASVQTGDAEPPNGAGERPGHLEGVMNPGADGRRLDLVDVHDRQADRPDLDLERTLRHELPDPASVGGGVHRPDLDHAALDERSVGARPAHVVAPRRPGEGSMYSAQTAAGSTAASRVASIV